MASQRFELVIEGEHWSTETLDAFVAEVLRVAEQYGTPCHIEVPLFGGDMGLTVRKRGGQ